MIILQFSLFAGQGMETANVKNRGHHLRVANSKQRLQVFQIPAATQITLKLCSIHQVEMSYLRNNTYFCPECLGLN